MARSCGGKIPLLLDRFATIGETYNDNGVTLAIMMPYKTETNL